MSIEGENHSKTVSVIRAMREGLGVEDMQARGVCDAEYARRVISRLRDQGMLENVLKPRASA